MIEWRGIAADTADVDETSGVSALQLNTRMRIDGELQRRYGMLSTGLPPLDGPVLYLASGSGFVVRGTATNVDGDPDPVDIPVGPIRRPPIIDVIRQGGGWTTESLAWGGTAHYAYFAPPGVAHSCSGVIEAHVGDALPGVARLTCLRERSAPYAFYVIYDQIVTTGEVVTIQVPWDDTFPQITFIAYDCWGRHEGQSTPGCAI